MAIGEAAYNGAMVGYWTNSDEADTGGAGEARSGFVTGDVTIGVDVARNGAATATVEIEDVMRGSTNLGDLAPVPKKSAALLSLMAPTPSPSKMSLRRAISSSAPSVSRNNPLI